MYFNPKRGLVDRKVDLKGFAGKAPKQMESLSCDSSFLNEEMAEQPLTLSSDLNFSGLSNEESENLLDKIENSLQENKNLIENDRKVSSVDLKSEKDTQPTDLPDVNNSIKGNNSEETGIPHENSQEPFDILTLFGRAADQNEFHCENNQRNQTEINEKKIVDQQNREEISQENVQKTDEIDDGQNYHEVYDEKSQSKDLTKDFSTNSPIKRVQPLPDEDISLNEYFSQFTEGQKQVQQKLCDHPNSKLSTVSISEIKKSQDLKFQATLTVQVMKIDIFSTETSTLILSDDFDTIPAVIANSTLSHQKIKENGILTIKDFSVWRINGSQINIAKRNILEL